MNSISSGSALSRKYTIQFLCMVYFLDNALPDEIEFVATTSGIVEYLKQNVPVYSEKKKTLGQNVIKCCNNMATNFTAGNFALTKIKEGGGVGKPTVWKIENIQKIEKEGKDIKMQ